MPPIKSEYSRYVLALFLVALNVSPAKPGLIRIPVSISPIIQESCIEISRTANFFYQLDKEFYSRVTVLDAARNEGKDISEIIKYKISVLFIITASSHVSGSLTLNNLKYSNSYSKWSYQIPAQHILEESNGTFAKLPDRIPVYKVQELAMKALERKYGFSVSYVLRKLRLKPMEFFAVDERQWIDVVGVITGHVIRDRCRKLNLTPCYLAELINKTQKEMESFTLDEVDMYLYNISMLKEKLAGYRNATLSSLHETFNITASQLARMSNVNTSVINTMGLKNLIELFLTTISKSFHLQSSPYMVEARTDIPCQPTWNSFRKVVVLEAFKNEARNMSITSQTLASLIHVPDEDIKMFSFNRMLQVLRRVVKPIKYDKNVIENYTLSMLQNIHGSKRLNINEHNAIALIKRVTRFSKHQLKLLYGWTANDFHFGRLFSVAEVAEECKLDYNEYSLLIIATINIGKEKPGIKCQSFAALRLIWGQASLNYLQERFQHQPVVPLDKPIATAVSLLSNSSTKITNRVLSNGPIMREVLANVTLNKVSALTNFSTDYLKELSLQRITWMIHELIEIGLLVPSEKPPIQSIVNYSSKLPTGPTKEDLVRSKENTRGESPTALPHSSSTKSVADFHLLTVVSIVGFFRHVTVSLQEYV